MSNPVSSFTINFGKVPKLRSETTDDDLILVGDYPGIPIKGNIENRGLNDESYIMYVVTFDVAGMAAQMAENLGIDPSSIDIDFQDFSIRLSYGEIIGD